MCNALWLYSTSVVQVVTIVYLALGAYLHAYVPTLLPHFYCCGEHEQHVNKLVLVVCIACRSPQSCITTLATWLPNDAC
jgi:hypothetical protein